MNSLIECSGYEPDEFRSLLSWMLRDRWLIKEENVRFYWYDRLKALAMKNAQLLLKAVVEDHAAAPTWLIKEVAEFVEQRWACRDSYIAIKLMDDISRHNVDRNVSRAYNQAIQDELTTRWESKEITEPKVEQGNGELEYALEEFRRLSAAQFTEENVRAMGMYTIRVHQWCKEHKYPPLMNTSATRLKQIPELRALLDKSAMALLWASLFQRESLDEDGKERLKLLARIAACVSDKGWPNVHAMTVLWALYSLMEVGTMPNASGLTFEEVVASVGSSRSIESRLPIPAFAVDKNTARGRGTIDTSKKISCMTKKRPLLAANNILMKYEPIEASHGESPHREKQTLKDFKKKVEECESRLFSAAVPRLFEESNDEGEHVGDAEIEVDERWSAKRMRKPWKEPWRAVIQLSSCEPFDPQLMSILPKADKKNTVFDFEAGVCYSGPYHPKEALSALAISRMGTMWAKLESVPRIRLLLDAAKTQVFIEEPYIGERPALTEETQEVKIEQRSLYALTKREPMENLTDESKVEMLKTFVFRRMVGLPCLFNKCLVQGSTGKIHMADLQIRSIDYTWYTRCQRTVKRGSAHWLFDSLSSKSALQFVSNALENEKHTLGAVLKWLEELNVNKLPVDVIPEILAPFTIPWEDLQGNVAAIIDAYLPVAQEATSDEE